MTDTPLPKQELLLKILNMTTSDNDGTALAAIRQANAFLAKQGWDWDKLINAKIRVVENPFAKIATPGAINAGSTPRSPAQPAPSGQPAQRFPPQPSYSPGVGRMWEFNQNIWDWLSKPDPNYRPPQPAASPRSAQPRSAFKGLGLSKNNVYANNCWCCGDYVNNNAGFIMKPVDFNKAAVVPNKSGWAVCCKPCEASRTPDSWGVPARAAPRNTGQTTVQGPAPSLNNL